MKPWGYSKSVQRALKGRHSCLAQGEMRTKPDMKPWVHTSKSKMSSDKERHLPPQANAPTNKYNTTQQPHTILAQEVPPLKGLNKSVPMINPGLTPWAMQEYRPAGAHCPNATINPTINPPPIPPNNPTIHKQYNQTNTKTRTNAIIHLHIQTHLTNTIPRHNTANAQSDKEPCKGDTPAKPRVE